MRRLTPAPPERATRPSGLRPSGFSLPVHRTGRMSDVDARDVTSLLRITFWFAPACILILSFFWYTLWLRGSIGGVPFGIMLVVDFPLAALGVLLINDFGSRYADAGQEDSLPIRAPRPSGPAYGQQEMHITRGEYRAAAESFRDHLTVEPHDHDARLRLAFLLESRLADEAGAETLYKQVRTRGPTPQQEAAATNGLIDLYRRNGRRDRLMVELARFAERHRGSRAGEGAARELAELKQKLA